MTDLDQLRPRTIEGVKRLAKQLKRRDGIQYAEALDRAARQAGCANFANARIELA
jgi:hypothetical protein